MTNESNFDLGPMDGYADQAQAADDVTGEAYENMLDQGFTTPEREPNVERWENEHETLDERLAQEEPDVFEEVDAERDAAWQTLRAVWPNFDLYEKRTDRRIPVFRLRPR